MGKWTHSAERPERVTLPVLVAPATDGARVNTLRPPLLPVACFAIAAPAFDVDSSFLLPAMQEELVTLARMLARFHDHPVAIFGHADPSGDDAHNKALSGRRATSLYALLVRRADLWEHLHATSTRGDRWGRRQSLLILTALSPAPGGDPYFTGAPTDAVTPDGTEAIRAFQRDSGLVVDGDPGPRTREQLYARYMDYLAGADAQASDGAVPLRLAPEDFLGRGASKAGKGDYQGCGERNPTMILSSDEAASLAQEDRADENAVNRRVVVYVFAKETTIDPERWPCPTVDEGPAGCVRRAWSDGEARRSPGAERRTFDATQDTFACRFYQRIAGASPCERPTSAPRTIDIFFDVPRAVRDLDQSYTLTSTDGTYAQTLGRAASLRLDDAMLALRFTGVRRGKRYTLLLDVPGATLPIFDDVPLDDVEDSGPDTPEPQPRQDPTPPEPEPRPDPKTKDPLLVEHPADTRDDPALYDPDPETAIS